MVDAEAIGAVTVVASEVYPTGGVRAVTVEVSLMPGGMVGVAIYTT